MTQEEKELLVKDLCARQSCGVKLYVDGDVQTLLNIEQDVDSFNQHKIYYIVDFIDDYGKFNFCSINEIKPYLRKLSSMTEDEEKEFCNIGFTKSPKGFLYIIGNYEQIDWLNSHHFDYRGLIEKGLALEAPEGMYKN